MRRGVTMVFRLSVFLALLVLLIPPQLCLMHAPRLRHVLPFLFFRIMLIVLGVRLQVTGPMPRRGTLLVANHMSWFDIALIGALTPTFFIAKSDVKAWPLFGQLALLNNTLFVQRRLGRHTLKERSRLTDRLERGETMVLFAEGTSSDGLRVLPFKSSLFAAVEEVSAETPVQGMTLAYTRIHGIAMGRKQRLAYGWIGDATLIPHFLFIFGGPPLSVDIVLHPPLPHGLNRKQMAHALHHQVSEGLDRLTRGAPHPVAADIAALELAAQKS